MRWYEYGLFVVFGLYVLVALGVAPYLAKRGKRYRSPVLREQYRQTLRHIRWSLMLCIGVLILGAVFNLPLSGSRFFAGFGIILLAGAVILLFLWRYLSSLILAFEGEQ